MAFKAPYGSHNFLGNFVDDAAALIFIKAVRFDSTKDGFGNPEEGMWYSNTTTHMPRYYNGTSWEDMGGGGTGNVVGPSGATNEGIVRFNGTTGELIQNSSVIIGDDGYVSIPSGQKYKINGVNLSATDVGAEPTLTKGNLTELNSDILNITGGTGSVIGGGTSIQINKASASQDGYLGKNDWSIFNSKEPAQSKGSISSGTASAINISNGSSSTVGPNVSISINKASVSQDGYLGKNDWSTFNSKENVLTFQNSITRSVNTINLVNDSTSPGNTKFYGTNSGGTKGWYDFSVSPAGSDGYVQYNNNGVMGGANPLYWDDYNGNLGIGTTSPAGRLHVVGQPGTGSGSGGDLIYTVSGSGGITYRVHKFTSLGTTSIVLPAGITSVEYLVVAGGGGGGTFGGGGAGGVIYGTLSVSSGSYSVTVGDGGAGANGSGNAYGTTGNNSVFSTITSHGGGGGGYWGASGGTNGLSGGSGGGGGGCDSGSGGSGGTPTSGEGNTGGSGSGSGSYTAVGGGGGGAGATGQSGTANVKGGDGGIGISSSISGTTTYYGGGGGGGCTNETTVGSGGGGGGGNGVYNSGANPAVAGTSNTGGGGGGGWGAGYAGRKGGSGIVIVRYAITPPGGQSIIDCNLGVGTSDLDGTPAIGRLTVQSSYGVGASNIFVGRNSSSVNVITIDSYGYVNIGAASTKTGKINFLGTTSGTVGLTVADAAGSWTLTLPTTGGTNGWYLQTNGSGVTTWAAASGSTAPGGSNGHVQFNSSSSFGGDAAHFWDNTNKRLGIGCTDPNNALEISANATALGQISSFGTGVIPALAIQGGRGTRAVSTPVQSGDAIGTIYFCGVYQNNTPAGYAGAYINAAASENWSASAVGSNIQFFTTAKTTTTRVERIRIIDSGSIGIGCTDPVQKLEVSADASVYQVISAYGTTSASGLILYKGRGSRAAKTPVLSGDSLGTIYFGGVYQNNTAEFSSTYISGLASENWASGAVGSELRFYTTAKTTGSVLERIRITDAGALQVGLVSGATGKINLLGTTSGVVSLTVADTAGSWTMTLPAAVPAVTGYVLSATTAGICSWVAQSGGGAPTGASYWTSTAESGLSNETNIGALTTGLLKISVSGGVATPSTASSGTDYEPPVTKTNLTETSSSILTISNGTGAVIGASPVTIQVKKASSSQDGYLAKGDWYTFNSKEPAVTKGNLTETNSSIFIFGGTTTNNVIGSGTTIQVKKASALQDGYLGKNDFATFSAGAHSPVTLNASAITGGLSLSTQELSFRAATDSLDGYLKHSDWTTFNNKQNTLSFYNLSEVTSGVLTITGGPSSVVTNAVTIQVKKASVSQDGYLGKDNWATFNAKEPALTKGNLTETSSSILIFSGSTTNNVIGTGTAIQIKKASASQDGYLGKNDFATFSASTHSPVTLSASAVTGGLSLSTQELSFRAADTTYDGYLKSSDWDTFNGKQNALTPGDISSGTASVIEITNGNNSTIGPNVTIAINKASASLDGYLGKDDWSLFNGKQDVITKYDLSETSSGILSITGGTDSVLTNDVTIAVQKASAAQDGYLGKDNWATFNGKLTSPMTTNGDLIARIGGVADRLGIGSTGQVLTVAAGLPAWADPAAGTQITQGDTKVYVKDTGSDGYMAVVTDGTEKMRVTPAGYVGIGVEAPTSMLDVAGSVEISSNQWYYVGDPLTDGSWRMGLENVEFIIQKRITGLWVTKGTFA